MVSFQAWAGRARLNTAGKWAPAAQADGMAEGQRRRGRDRDAEEDRGPAADGAATEEEDGRRRVSDSATITTSIYTNYYLHPPNQTKILTRRKYVGPSPARPRVRRLVASFLMLCYVML